VSGGDADRRLAWYVAYGSNLRLDRLRCYLAGGSPPGARRACRGGRDPADPRQTRSLRLPGRIRFAGTSSVWGGGMAFYDPEPDGWVAARAYLLTMGQVNDLVAQETRRPPGTDLRLDQVVLDGRGTVAGARYETVLCLGERAGWPALTITSLDCAEPVAPAAPYLWTIASGLAEAFAWTADGVADYLLAAPGVAGAWTRDRIVALQPPGRRARASGRSGAAGSGA
jgi:hypothetical protein